VVILVFGLLLLPKKAIFYAFVHTFVHTCCFFVIFLKNKLFT